MTRTSPTLAFSTVTALLLAAILLAPTVPAQEVEPEAAMLALYLREAATGTGAVLGFEPSSLATGRTVSALGPNSLNAAAPCVTSDQLNFCSAAVLGSVKSPVEFNVSGDSGLSLWLSTTSPVPQRLSSLTFTVNSDKSGVLYTFGIGTYPRDGTGAQQLVLDSTPRQVRLAAPAPATPIQITPTHTLSFQIRVWVAAATPAVADVLVHYGAQQSTGLLFAGSASPEALAEIESGASVGGFLAESAVSFDAPLGLVNRTKAAGLTATSAAQPTEMAWGSSTSTDAIEYLTDGLFALNVIAKSTGVPPTATPRLGVDFIVTLGTKKITGYSVISASAGTVAPSTSTGSPGGPVTPSVIRFLGLVPLKGEKLAVGDKLAISLTLRASNVNADYDILYGSVYRPSGFQAIAKVESQESGGGGETDIILTATPTTAAAPPGGNATIGLLLKNQADEAVEVELVVTTNASATLERSSVSLAGASERPVNLTVVIPQGAEPGDQVSVLVEARIAGAAAANVTILVEVAGSAGNGEGGTGGSGSNDTGSPQDTKQPSGKNAVPGFGAGALLAGLAVAMLVIGRRLRR